jgi:two-component system sensor histidine kinase VicK
MQKADYSFITKLGDISGDGIAVFDLNIRQFVYTNTYFRNIFEIGLHEDIGDGSVLLQYVSDADRAYLNERYMELLSIGCISETEFALKLKSREKRLSGDVLWLEESYAIALFVKDVSRQKELDDYVLKFTAQKDALLDMLIHNLSGPLALSRDVIDLIGREAGDGSARISNLVNIIRRNTEECLEIVNDFLKKEFSESSRTSVQKRRFDCVGIIRDVLSTIEIMNHGKKLVFDSADKAIDLNSDPVKFLQIIQNLLSNAIKFTGEKGSITIKIVEDKGFVTITVSDDGIGIPGNQKSQIFSAKVNGRTGLNGELSNGMGLFLTSQLVTLLSGEIWFESREGNGSLFGLKFPLD